MTLDNPTSNKSNLTHNPSTKLTEPGP